MRKKGRVREKARDGLNVDSKRSDEALVTLETIHGERRGQARRILEGYRAYCEMHDRMLHLIEDADSRLLSTTAQMGETVSSSSAGDAIGGGLVKLETASNMLQSVDDRICSKLDMALWLVESVIEINPSVGRVISERYLVPAGEEPTFEEIAERLNYSYDWVRHAHLLGLDMVAMLLQDDTF